MSTHQAVALGLKNFLTSFTGRYSDPDCFFFFGGLLQELNAVHIDLLAPTAGESQTPLGIASRIACGKFESQLRLAGFELSRFQSASLTMTRSPEEVHGSINGFACVGSHSRFEVQLTLDNGKRCTRDKIIFFAPYDPAMDAQPESPDAPPVADDVAE